MKHALLLGFTGAASVVATLGLSAIAHADEPGSEEPVVTGPQAPGPVIPVGSDVPVPPTTGPQLTTHAPGPEVPPPASPVTEPVVTGPHAPGPVIPVGSDVPVPPTTGPQLTRHAPGPVVPPSQPTQPGNGQGANHGNHGQGSNQGGNGQGSNHPNNGNGRGPDHSHHGKGH